MTRLRNEYKVYKNQCNHKTYFKRIQNIWFEIDLMIWINKSRSIIWRMKLKESVFVVALEISSFWVIGWVEFIYNGLVNTMFSCMIRGNNWSKEEDSTSCRELNYSHAQSIYVSLMLWTLILGYVFFTS